MYDGHGPTFPEAMDKFIAEVVEAGFMNVDSLFERKVHEDSRDDSVHSVE